MFAVREEVELLKEQIRSLVARNDRLEYENSFLRNHVGAQTLDQLQSAATAAVVHPGGATDIQNVDVVEWVTPFLPLPSLLLQLQSATFVSTGGATSFVYFRILP